MESRECLRKYFDELAHCLTGNRELLLLVTTQLYTRGFITTETQSQISSATNDPPLTLVIKLLSEVEVYITLQPGGLNTLVEILTNHELCRVVGEKIRLDSTCGNKLPPMSSHNALRILQDSQFNITSHWNQLGGDLGVSLDERRKLQELALRTQNYDGALEECLDTWIRNAPSVSWEGLVWAVERYELSTADRMRDILMLPRYRRSSSNIGSRLPRQGSSFESAGDTEETNRGTTSTATSSLPIRHTPSPLATLTTDRPHPPSRTSTNEISSQIESITILDTTSPQTTQGHDTNSDLPSVTTEPNGCRGNNKETTPTDDTEDHFTMECQLINAASKQVIKSSHTSQPYITTPIYRDIKIKKLTKYTKVPPQSPLVITASVNTKSYLYVINIGSSGNLATLVPNDEDDCNEAMPNGIVQFPPVDADYEFVLDNNCGTEVVMVLAYSSRVSVSIAEDDCRRISSKQSIGAVVERDITIKKKRTAMPLGIVEMQFSTIQ